MEKKVHFIGIGGIGMSALARILLQKGIKVTGSDLVENSVTRALKEEGAEIFYTHDSGAISPGQTVIFSSAVTQKNQEYQAAILQKAHLLHRSDLLKDLMQDYAPLLVAGTHGKTTVSSLLTYTLTSAELSPSYAVGGVLNNLSSNGGRGEGIYFVAEADESDGSFLKYEGFGGIITNIDNDHLDYWKTKEDLLAGFHNFSRQIRSNEHLFWCKDDPALSQLALEGVSYGFSEDADLYISKECQQGWKTTFDCTFKGKKYEAIEISLVGRHNVLNASAVFGLALTLNISEEAIRKAFLSFSGVARRLEKKGEVHKILILDDYGHHPTEIATTLKAVKTAIEGRRLVVAFQPHRYTRTRDCFVQFLDAFKEADLLILTDIYSAGESPIEGITGRALFESVHERATLPVHFVEREEMELHLMRFLQPHDVLITLGAGDITYLGSEFIHAMHQKPPRKLKLGVVYGGASLEHEVAKVSAQYVLKNINFSYYEMEEFIISKEGRWSMAKKEEKAEVPISKEIFEKIISCDLFFPVLHGPFGEDGAIQGFFETLGIAYVGCDYRSCAIAMDKSWTKHIAARHGIPIVDFLDFKAVDWEKEQEECLAKILDHFSFPLFVKPVHLGSSMGVRRVQNREELCLAIEGALAIDCAFLVEKEVKGREIEFGVIGNDKIWVASPAEIHTAGQIHDYEKKYGPNANAFDIPPKLSIEKIDEGKQLARKIYAVLGCSGLARIDFFLDAEGRYFLNEVNPIPGMTPTSPFPMMWQSDGISSEDLLDKWIVWSMQRKREHGRKLMPKSNVF